MPEPRDAAERARAIDPTRSFLVQAPAGSGKTELLIQRYLVLLARVEQPESVLAITFTRKAAGEMRRRVLDAIDVAAGPEPGEQHKRRTWQLARAVRERDASRHWMLAGNPNRLNIRTIDSLCESITRRMPWLSRMGSHPEMLDDARPLFREAARATIDLLETSEYGPALERILLHVDNDYAALENLIADMLARRDQWLRHLSGVETSSARPVLEQCLAHIVEEALAAVCRSLPREFAPSLISLAAFAAERVDAPNPIAACAGLTSVPGEELDIWLGIRNLLLTTEGGWRKRIDKSIGLPPQAKQEKQRCAELIEALRPYERFRARLDALRNLPPARFDQRQWEVLEALVPVLLAAAAQLHLVFRRHSTADFSEVTLASLRALGSPDEPTDLALALDCRIEHLLIDEFQDTSITHADLVRKLTAGWEPGDGRTLFIVGDPMQSIYRFREAEVGLFLRAAEDGIGSVPLEFLQLNTNFRSDAGIVEWVNRTFPDVLASANDVALGAVRFSPSHAVRPDGECAAVHVHPFFDQSDAAEAERVVCIVREAQADNADTKIGLLVRARAHLPSILFALRRAGIAYRAVEIDELGDLSITQDLVSLTRALLDPADRVAWLAILRAPWCGLTLADLHTIAGGDQRQAIWDAINDEVRLARLTADGRPRLARFRATLAAALARRGARLRPWVEGCWLALGGPACATQPGELDNALAVLDLIEQLDQGGDLDIDELAIEVTQLFAAPDPTASDRLEVMTIHKSKGLEFDVVILAGLGRRVNTDKARLLAWLERPSESGTSDLLLAPMKPVGGGADPLYNYVRSIESAKTANELGRLLYVAATRARRHLHLLGAVRTKADGDAITVVRPNSGFLAALWHVVAPEFETAAAQLAAPEQQTAAPLPPARLRRLVSGWTAPPPPPRVSIELPPPTVEPPARMTFEWVGDTLRHIGTVVHRMFEQIAQDGLACWTAERIFARHQAIENALRTLGVASGDLSRAADTVTRAVSVTIAGERGRWILDNTHSAARSEYALTGMLDGRLITARVDRTFIDADGVRWIIDFKTSAHEGGDRESFLDNERERWREKMLQYAALFAKFDSRPVCMGLYFPLLDGWREYEVVQAAAPARSVS